MNTVTTIIYDALIIDNHENSEHTIQIEIPYTDKNTIRLKSKALDRIGGDVELERINYTQTLNKIKETIENDGYEIIEVKERDDSYPSKNDPDWVRKVKEQIAPSENEQ